MLTSLREAVSLLGPWRRQALGLFLLMCLMPFVELGGIGMVFGFVQAVTDPAQLEQKEWFQATRAFFAIESTRDALLAMGVLTLLALLFRNTMQALNVWATLFFAAYVTRSLSARVLLGYLVQPLLFHNDSNSANLSRNILEETGQLVGARIVGAMQLISDGFMVVVVMAGLLWFDPVVTMGAAVLIGGAYGLISLRLRRYTMHLGRERMEANGRRYREVSQGLSGVRDLQVLGRYRHAVARFHDAATRLAQVVVRVNLLTETPRLLLEILVFGGIVLLVLYKISSGYSGPEVMALISLYAMAAYRLMPITDRITRSITRMRANQAVMDNLRFGLAEGKKAEAAPEPTREKLMLRESLRLDNVSFSYPGTGEAQVRHLSLTFGACQSVAFVGPSGAGKSTIVNLLLGLLPPTEGQLLVDGEPLAGDRLRKWQNNIGYVPQDIFLADDTITRNIAFGLADAQIDEAQVERVARLAHLHEFITAELPDGYRTMVGERGVRLSGGQRQRIGIARALYHEPQLLVFDEATSALDGITERVITEAIQTLSKDKAVVVVAHRLTTVRGCDRIFLLEKGSVATAGTYDELMAGSKVFRRMAGETR